MSKLQMAFRLLLSKNYLVICDRHSQANVRTMFLKSFRQQLKKMDKKLADGLREAQS